jgi:hypothetical protein
MSNKNNPKIKIDNFTIHRTLGKSVDWKKLDIKKKHVEALNEIGHSGKLNKKRTTIQDYFKKNIDGNGLKHEITSLKSNTMEFTDTLLVTRATVTIKK